MPGLLEPLAAGSVLQALPMATPQVGIGDEEVWYCPTLDDSFEDISGNGHDLDTITGGMATVPDVGNGGSRAYYCNGVDQYAKCTTNPVGINDNFSVSCWIKGETLGATRPAWLMGAGSNANGISFCANHASRAGGLLGSVAWITPTNFDVISGQWYHMVLMRDAGTTRVYLDGVVGNTTSGSNARSNSVGVTMGWNEANNRFNGWLDDCRFWKRVLTAEEITHLGTSRGVLGPPGQPPGEDVDLTAVAGSTHTSGQTPTLEVSAPIDLTVPAGASHSVGQAPTLQIGENVDLVALAGTSQTVGQTPILEAQKNVDLTVAVGTTDTSGQAPTLQIGANVDITVQAGQSISQGRVPQLEIGGNVQITVPPGLTRTEGQTPVLQVQENVDLVALAGQSVTVGQIPSLIAGGGISMAAMAVSTQVIQAQIDA